MTNVSEIGERAEAEFLEAAKDLPRTTTIRGYDTPTPRHILFDAAEELPERLLRARALASLLERAESDIEIMPASREIWSLLDGALSWCKARDKAEKLQRIQQIG